MLNRELFPQCGRVVILDDKMDEVKGLITLLSKQSIPFVYLDHVPEEYESYTELGIRIIFLDLVLEGSTDEKTVKSVLYNNLSRLIKKNNGPYIIAVWSTQREHYQKQIEELKDELDCSPDKIIYLDKTPFKDFKEELYESLENSFKDVFQDCSLLSFISLWENSINSSTIKVTSEFDEILPQEVKRKASVYAANLARMILARRTLGEDMSNENRVGAAYEGLNLLLNKEANNNITQITKTASEIVSVNSTEKKVKEIQANTLLWIGDKYTFNAPKNVYKSEKQLEKVIFPKQDLYNLVHMIVEIDITHKCAYYQKKGGGHQLVYGVLFKDKGFKKNDKNSYWLRIGDILFEEQEMTLAVYLGEILNKTDEVMSNREAIFSISDEVYSEIRSELSAFYSKSGKTEF
ncbi:MAG: hypothetical protein IJV77_05680 [Clostridia bacterium]|nr:hypothetical protein [Clostridia bacterium]